MRKCINGAFADTTSVCMAYLASTPNPLIRHLILIGDPEDPFSYRLTDHEGPVQYNPWGTFSPSVVSRGQVKAEIGLTVQSLSLEWSPSNLAFTQSQATANPYQLARQHFYDNWTVRIWRIFMPTPGDANTLGGCEWFGGRIADTQVERGKITFTINSFMDVLTQKLPPNVIESTSTLASYTAATIPAGDASVPTFSVVAGTSTTVILADTLTPTANRIYETNVFVAGYMIFLASAGATLAGFWSAIGSNLEFTDGNGNHHNQFNIYSPFPWAPTPGVDTFYVSTAAPINLADGDYFGFPFVPQPTAAA
jgi:hypothetical protein